MELSQTMRRMQFQALRCTLADGSTSNTAIAVRCKQEYVFPLHYEFYFNNFYYCKDDGIPDGKRFLTSAALGSQGNDVPVTWHSLLRHVPEDDTPVLVIGPLTCPDKIFLDNVLISLNVNIALYLSNKL